MKPTWDEIIKARDHFMTLGDELVVTLTNECKDEQAEAVAQHLFILRETDSLYQAQKIALDVAVEVTLLQLARMREFLVSCLEPRTVH